MSHTTTIKAIAIVDIEALRAAIAELAQSGVKISLQEGGKPRAYFPDQKGLGTADFVIKLGDAKYDVGVYKNDTGSYELRTDFWSGSVEGVLGAAASSAEKRDQAKLGKLYQMYGVHATLRQARKQGYSARRITAPDGTIKLELEVAA